MNRRYVGVGIGFGGLFRSSTGGGDHVWSIEEIVSLLNGGEMRRGLTAIGGMVLGMIVGIIFEPSGEVMTSTAARFSPMVFGLAFGGAVAGLRRSRS